MNHHGNGIMDPVMLASVKADLASVLHDPTVGVSVTVSTPTGTTVTRGSGAWSTTDTSNTITALLLALTAREVELSNGAYRASDRRLRVLKSDLSTTPTTDTRFTSGGVTYAVIALELDPLELHYNLIGRAVS